MKVAVSVKKRASKVPKIPQPRAGFKTKDQRGRDSYQLATSATRWRVPTQGISALLMYLPQLSVYYLDGYKNNNNSLIRAYFLSHECTTD